LTHVIDVYSTALVPLLPTDAETPGQMGQQCSLDESYCHDHSGYKYVSIGLGEAYRKTARDTRPLRRCTSIHY